MNKLCWIVAWIAIACRHKIYMPLYITVTSNGLFLFKSSKEKCVQNSAFENYFKTSLTTAKDDYAKIFHWKYWGRLKLMSHKDHEITLYITMFDYLGGHLHQVIIKLEFKRKNFISLLQPFEIGRTMDR